MKPLRKFKILHRDIKPDNILIDRVFSEGRVEVKMCDFGLSTLEKEGKQNMYSHERVGTLHYQSP